MNTRTVIKYLGIISIVSCSMFIPSILCALLFGEYHMVAVFINSFLATTGIGLLLWSLCRKKGNRLRHPDSLALVTFSWILMAGYCAIPYVLSGNLGVIDAYFESMSGLTTTGSSILVDIEALPKSLLFWRSFTHWYGGMGIIVLVIIVLPFLGAGGKLLYRSEVPGINKQGIRPKIKDSAIVLLKIYLGLTALETLLLMVAGMSPYDALCHSFGTIATGGYSPRNASIAAYNSLAIEIIIIFFMAAGATNFGIYYLCLTGKWREGAKNSEWHIFLLILVVSTILITFNLLGAQGVLSDGAPEGGAHTYTGFWNSLRLASFQVVSCMTTTGFATTDFNLWPQFSRTLLVVLMLIGGCSGSTSGGLKVVRIFIIVKIFYMQIRRTFQPKKIYVLRINDTIIENDIQYMVLAFFALYIFTFIIAVLLLSLMGLPTETAISSVAATINGVGPGLQLVGAVSNFSMIPDAGKLLLCLVMLLGRLELYAIFALFVPAFWKRT
jgi:trk system potassium uptake protein